MTITIITIGNKSSHEISLLIDSFTKRLPKNIHLKWILIKSGAGDVISSMQKESENILSSIPKNNRVILLDETGKQMSSPELSGMIFSSQKDTTFIIGGAYGVAENVKQIADTAWSLGKLVFPHQIVRLILAEQIYRAYTISVGHPYHHS